MIKSFNVGILAALGFVAADVAGDAVTSLPSCPELQSKTYSGYLTITGTKKLHYVYAESLRSPRNDPVLLWSNGGPGCSSLLGLFQENGPYTVDNVTQTCTHNPYSWSHYANMLYIEAPAGVGYSVGSGAEDQAQNDMSQSEDLFKAVEQFFISYPERLGNDLFLSGESYAGIYVPYLAWQIYQSNEQYKVQNHGVIPPKGTEYNLKGMMVGNGATNWAYDNAPSVPGTLWGFNMIQTSQYNDYINHNCTQYFGGGTANGEIFKEGGDASCELTNKGISDLGDEYFVYDYYRESADVDATKDFEGKKPVTHKGMTVGQYTPWAKHGNHDTEVMGTDWLTSWLNEGDVRTAMHIDESAPEWQMCSDPVYAQYHLQQEASHWIYPILRYNGIRMAFYSGDTDGAIPTYGSKRWIKELDFPPAIGGEWRPWYTGDQISGYVENYDGLDFVTFRGVGHMAPQWAPKAAQNFVNLWLNNQHIAPPSN